MYEDLSSGENVIIGYFFTGGIGSHPVLVSSTMDEMIESNLGLNFAGYDATSVEDKVPDALICAYDDMSSWRIKGISRGLANSIISKIGGNYIGMGDAADDDDDDGEEDKLELANEILKMVGEDPFNDSAYDANITIILDPKINTIYWSDAPESEHSIWKPPYEEIHILERYYDMEDLYIPNIETSRLIELMQKKGVIPTGSI